MFDSPMTSKFLKLFIIKCNLQFKASNSNVSMYIFVSKLLPNNSHRYPSFPLDGKQEGFIGRKCYQVPFIPRQKMQIH
jgi:hypothetical protein